MWRKENFKHCKIIIDITPIDLVIHWVWDHVAITVKKLLFLPSRILPGVDR